MIDIPETKISPRTHINTHYKPGRNKPSKFEMADFVAWDGEGFTDKKGKHHYFLLANSSGRSIANMEGLSTIQCLDFLISEWKQHPDSIHVIFAGGYDVNKILKDLPWDTLHRLYSTNKCYFDEYKMEWFPGKSFYVRRKDEKSGLKLWDVFSFFQSSFVDTISKWHVGTEDIVRYVAENKERRASFLASDLPSIRKYCDTELSLLVSLMGSFRLSLEEAHITLSQWHGPGAIASFYFKKYGTQQHQEVLPDDVQRAAQYAYFGGRIEQVRYGHSDGRIFCYDINSAYPAVISELPSLRGSRWEHCGGNVCDVRPFSLYKVRLGSPTGIDDIGPLPWRHHDGSIRFHFQAVVWVWTPEYELLKSLDYDHEVLESWIFSSGNNDAPFGWVRDIYETRREWKRSGLGSEKVLKLGINSLYGKMVQQIGWKEGRNIPPFHQLEWGGYVTSATRAKLFRAAHEVQTEGLIGFETDAIFSSVPLAVHCSDELGDWSVSEYDGITYVQPGVYWLGRGNNAKNKCRGFNKGSLKENDILAAYETGATKITSPSTRFQTLGTSLRSHRSFRTWGDWITDPDRELSLYPQGKRIGDPSGNPAKSLVGTFGSTCGYEESAPHLLAWKDGKDYEDYMAKLFDHETEADFDGGIFLEDD